MGLDFPVLGGRHTHFAEHKSPQKSPCSSTRVSQPGTNYTETPEADALKFPPSTSLHPAPLQLFPITNCTVLPLHYGLVP